MPGGDDEKRLSQTSSGKPCYLPRPLIPVNVDWSAGQCCQSGEKKEDTPSRDLPRVEGRCIFCCREVFVRVPDAVLANPKARLCLEELPEFHAGKTSGPAGEREVYEARFCDPEEFDWCVPRLAGLLFVDPANYWEGWNTQPVARPTSEVAVYRKEETAVVEGVNALAIQRSEDEKEVPVERSSPRIEGDCYVCGRRVFVKIPEAVLVHPRIGLEFEQRQDFYVRRLQVAVPEKDEAIRGRLCTPWEIRDDTHPSQQGAPLVPYDLADFFRDLRVEDRVPGRPGKGSPVRKYLASTAFLQEELPGDKRGLRVQQRRRLLPTGQKLGWRPSTHTDRR